MGDAILFKTARADGEHLGPGSYDLPSTLTNGKLAEAMVDAVAYIASDVQALLRRSRTKIPDHPTTQQPVFAASDVTSVLRRITKNPDHLTT